MLKCPNTRWTSEEVNMEAILGSNSQHPLAGAKATNSSTTTILKTLSTLQEEAEVLQTCLEAVQELLETHHSAVPTQACPVARSTWSQTTLRFAARTMESFILTRLTLSTVKTQLFSKLCLLPVTLLQLLVRLTKQKKQKATLWFRPNHKEFILATQETTSRLSKSTRFLVRTQLN